METKILSIFTRTPLHVGCGSSVGAVDQSVVRERHTGYPVIPGSALKGVLADLWNDDPECIDKIARVENGKKVVQHVRKDSRDVFNLFGNDSTAKTASAGSLLIGEGKLLAFPIRSAKNCFAWLTCPLALERFKRDTGAKFAPIEDGKTLAAKALKIDENVIFEEYPVEVTGELPDDLVSAMKEACEDLVWKNNLATHLAVISDDLFAYFAKNACEIANHNRIDDAKGVVVGGALFSQENVPSETLFYAVFNSQKRDDFDKVEAKLNAVGKAIQIGADMTTGLGWCTVGFKN